MTFRRLTKLIFIRIISNHYITAPSKNDSKLLTPIHLPALDIRIFGSIIDLKYETLSQQINILIIGVSIGLRVASEDFSELGFH
jgi:hypothetical protein